MMDDEEKTIMGNNPPQTNVWLDDAETIPGGNSSQETTEVSDMFAPGEVLCGRYEVLSQLGKGGMGIVYECFDRTADKKIALKTIAPELASSSYEMEQTKENFKLVSDLHHPYIANYNDLEKDPLRNAYYLIMEYVNGEDVRIYLKRMASQGADRDALILKLLRQAAEALDYAHDKRIVHKDIKPANLMVDQDGNLKLLDFGLAAKIHSTLSRAKDSSFSDEDENFSGTLAYMSPEQLAGKWEKPTMDQYSLAAAAYEMFSGHPPFNAPTAASMKDAVRNEIPEPLENVSPVIAQVIAKALSKNPEDRFENCTAFVEALSGEVEISVKESEPEKLTEDELFQCYTLIGNIEPVLDGVLPADESLRKDFLAL